MTTLHRPILIEQGATFTLRAEVEFDGEPLNSLGYSARLRVWRRFRPLLSPVLDLSNDDGSEVVFEAEGVITFSATPEQTQAINWVPGRTYHYTAELVSPGGETVYRILDGRAVVTPGPGLFS